MEPDLKEKHTRALAQIAANGYHIREEWLDSGGGGCEIRGEKVYFEDISLTLPERLALAEDFLRELLT